MSFKTLSIDVEAYELLRSRKRAGQSFSAVIKHELRRGGRGEDLLRALEHAQLGPDALDAIEREIADRGASPAEPVRL